MYQPMTVTIYTRQTCYYCVQAKRLLDQLDVQYHEIPVDGDAARRQEMQDRSGRHTVPQIWIGETHIGGCDELQSMHRAGQLESMLAQGE